MPKPLMTYEEITEEVKALRDLIYRYNKGEQMPPDFKYRTTLWTLEHFRNKMRSMKKKENFDG